MRIFLFAFLFSLIYSQYHSSEWGSITSLLTPTGIQVVDDGTVYVSTAGGLLEFNPYTEEFNFIKTEEGLVYLDLATISTDRQGRLWLGCAYPQGCMQVYDPEIGLVRYFEDPLIVSINKIEIGENISFSVYQGTTSGDVGILEFKLDDDGLPEYQDFYNNFPYETITEIRDLDIFQDSVYVTTDQGIFVGNYTSNLKFSENWNEVYTGNDAMQFLPGLSPLILGHSSIFNRQGEDYCVDFIGNIIQAARKDEKIGVLTEEYYYEISDCIIGSFKIPVGDQSATWNRYNYDLRTFFTSFDYSGEDNVFIGLKDNGILNSDIQLGSHVIYTPNTPIVNSFQAITITKSGHLAATSHFGTLYYNGIDYKNYIPDNYYKYYSDESETFHTLSLDYSPGEDFPISIVEKDNGNLIYCNSGVNPFLGQKGTVIELDYTTNDIDKFDNAGGIIDGRWRIYKLADSTEYMMVSQIEKDHVGNIWIVNPFCEKYEHLLAIQMADDPSVWRHVKIPDADSYNPQTIALENRGFYKRVWIGFSYTKTIDNLDYSSGGIKVFNYTDLSFEDDDSSWLLIDNPDVFPGDSPTASIFSLVIDQMGFLWVLSEKGIQGYEVSGNNNITLDPLREYEDEDGDEVQFDFLTHLSYERGNRIKVDSQNNKWVITHQGVWVIQESMAYWPSEAGLHPENSGLLSDIVYDVAFDDDKGLAYLATDKGISILQIPFAYNPTEVESMYISPNPFIVPGDESVMIKNIPSGATIQIMTITGLLIKKIELATHISQTLWDGRNGQGEMVGTAVYLVAAHHPTEPNMVSKIAVIRK